MTNPLPLTRWNRFRNRENRQKNHWKIFQNILLRKKRFDKRHSAQNQLNFSAVKSKKQKKTKKKKETTKPGKKKKFFRFSSNKEFLDQSYEIDNPTKNLAHNFYTEFLGNQQNLAYQEKMLNVIWSRELPAQKCTIPAPSSCKQVKHFWVQWKIQLDQLTVAWKNADT